MPHAPDLAFARGYRSALKAIVWVYVGFVQEPLGL
jgi:hypothetical protein